MATNGKAVHPTRPAGLRNNAEPGHSAPGRPAADRRLNLYIDGYNFYVPLSSSGKISDYELAWCNFLSLGEHLVQVLMQQYQQFAGYQLGSVKYFTATIPQGMPSNAAGIRRKHDWLDALNHATGGRVEIIHGTFRPRKHRFYIEREELDQLVRAGIPVNWDLLRNDQSTYQPQLTVHEEKQTDVMLACSLLTDAALGQTGTPFRQHTQSPPHHRSNNRPTPSPCQAAIVMSADIDFLPAAEMAVQVFDCQVVIAFTYPHDGYNLNELATRRQGLFPRNISEDELRRCMLPSIVLLSDGRRLSLDDFRKTHFQRAPISKVSGR